MASVLGLPQPKCETIIKSIIHILKAHGMPYSKKQKNVHISHICNFGLIERKYLKAAIVIWADLKGDVGVNPTQKMSPGQKSSQ